ncbi:MAG: valine--tRNA ligase [Bacteroidia bacterium]|nr:valine--tRNA ligase [Bacteroidia bacterium]
MSELAKTYDPKSVEDKWYKYWESKKFFKSVPDEREPYTIVIPPPNVTGVLHMGHMLNNTIQDVLVRRARMQGKNACWVPGTDHASIATEAKVVNLLREKGIKKSDLSREAFLDHAWAWKEKYGGIILKQLEKLGASCDWDRTRFTMEPLLSEAVIDVFIDLYNKDLIYRGYRMVNWDPKALTAVSDEEVYHKEVRSKLYHLQYALEDGSGSITIATTRPETILGDTAICVHPEDERYRALVGKKALVPLINRSIPIIADEYVDQEFGTGALKVTPAHDVNDYELGKKHNLETIDIFNANATLNEKAQLYVGEDRFAVRKKIAVELEEKDYLVKVEEIANKVGCSERTDEVIEPRLSLQWFVRMEGLVKPALENVVNGNIKFHPAKFVNTYRYWMENVKDWCISRQLWWGQQIPAWYTPDGSYVVAKTKEEAIRKFENRGFTGSPEEIKQDEDVVDTWFSSWLWPISVFDGFKDPENAEIKYYYPTNDLVTAPEILFFWVARMIIAGYEYRGQLPFTNVYLTGIVRDKLGRKMSKSLGNSPDPLDLIDKFGADGVRMGMLLCSPAGNDILFDESQVEQGRNFCNKIWNAYRLIQSWEVKNDAVYQNTIPIRWFEERLDSAIAEIEDKFSQYKLSDALMIIYKLIWDDFCSWYLEMIKPGYQEPIDRATYDKTLNFLEMLMKVLHPFMPFITEEIYHLIKERGELDCVTVSRMPTMFVSPSGMEENFELVKGLISQIRNIRNEKGISPKEGLSLHIKGESDLSAFFPIIKKLANLDEIVSNSVTGNNASTFVIKGTEYGVPLTGKIDMAAEKKKLEQELAYARGFLNSVLNKLANERFVQNAKPEVLQMERQKKEDTEAKISSLEQQIAAI